MKRFFRWFCIAGVGLLGLSYLHDAWAFSGDIESDPSKLVDKYLSLDKRGARLQANSQVVLKPYVAWMHEPAWGKIIVISKYHVIEDVAQWEVLTSTEVLIPVTFNVVGTVYWETATFLPESQVSLEYFHVKAIHERWRIVAPQLPPHVGKKRLINFIRLSQLEETQENKKVMLQYLRDQLKQAP